MAYWVEGWFYGRSFTPIETSMGSAIFIIGQEHAEFQWRIDSSAVSAKQRVTSGRFPCVSFFRNARGHSDQRFQGNDTIFQSFQRRTDRR